MYKPLPLHTGRRRPGIRPRLSGSRCWAWAGNLLAAAVTGALVLAAEWLPDLLAGWIF